jgi:hypothetical protein
MPCSRDCALLVAGTAALENAGKNIQIHGIGFSEADPHLPPARATPDRADRRLRRQILVSPV